MGPPSVIIEMLCGEREGTASDSPGRALVQQDLVVGKGKVYDQNGRVLVVIPPLPGVRAADSAYDLFYFGNILYGYESKGIIYRYIGPL